jgi:mRNA turnover protein 4
MRSNKFKNVRLHFRNDDDGMTGESRIFLGKNKLLQIALGRTQEEEYADNICNVSKRIVGGSVGLLVTSRPRMEVENYFASMVEPDFARAGSIASRSAVVTSEMLTHFPVSMMEQFRKLGLPVEIKKGQVVFRDGVDEYKICAEGETLSAEKCKLLVHFDIMLSDFKISLVCRWSKGEFDSML